MRDLEKEEKKNKREQQMARESSRRRAVNQWGEVRNKESKNEEK